MIVDKSDIDPTDFEDDYEVFVSIVVEDIEQMEHFIMFYEDLLNTLKAGGHEAEEEFLISTPDIVTGGLEFFVGFSFENEDVNEPVEELLHSYADSRDDTFEFEVPDLTGRTKSLKVDTTNFDNAQLPAEFVEFFDYR